MFTPIHTLVGGFLLHLSSSTLLASLGRVFGGSSIIDGALFGDHATWRWATLAGLVAAPWVNKVIKLDSLWDIHFNVDMATAVVEPVAAVVNDWKTAVAAGLLLGIGSKLGSGCTSGHFLCGVSRLSPRSLVATATFFTSAVITSYVSSAPSSITALTTPSYIPFWPSKSQYIPLLLLPLTLNLVLTTLSSSKLPTLPVALLSGYTFSTGLLLSGMASPLKVLRFLHLPIPGLFHPAEWDPSLIMVVIGGILPNALHWVYVVKPKMEEPKTKVKYYVPKGSAARNITPSLIIGAVLFGVGWGMTGTCLLPAVVNAGRVLAGGVPPQQMKETAMFVGSLVGGMGLVRAFGG